MNSPQFADQSININKDELEESENLDSISPIKKRDTVFDNTGLFKVPIPKYNSVPSTPFLGRVTEIPISSRKRLFTSLLDRDKYVNESDDQSIKKRKANDSIVQVNDFNPSQEQNQPKKSIKKSVKRKVRQSMPNGSYKLDLEADFELGDGWETKSSRLKKLKAIKPDTSIHTSLLPQNLAFSPKHVCFKKILIYIA